MIIEREIAEIMAEEPPRDQAMALCIQAWFELDTCRSIGMTVGPIPWDRILAWCEFHDGELDRDAAQQLMGVIRQLDVDRAEREASKQRLEQARGGQ